MPRRRWRQLGTTTSALVGRPGGAAPSTRRCLDGRLVSIVLPAARPRRRSASGDRARCSPRAMPAGSSSSSTTAADDRTAAVRRSRSSSPIHGSRRPRRMAWRRCRRRLATRGFARRAVSIVAFLDSDNRWLPRPARHRRPGVRAPRDRRGPSTNSSSLERTAGVRPMCGTSSARSLDLDRRELHRPRRRDRAAQPARRAPRASRRGGRPFDTPLRAAVATGTSSSGCAARANRRASTPSRARLRATSGPRRISTLVEALRASLHRIAAPHRRPTGGRAPGPLRRVALPPGHRDLHPGRPSWGCGPSALRCEVWSEEDVAVPYEPEVPWPRGTPRGPHPAHFRPDLVLSHWLHVGPRPPRRSPDSSGIPHAVRCHGFDYDEGIVDELARRPRRRRATCSPPRRELPRSCPNVVIDSGRRSTPQRVRPDGRQGPAARRCASSAGLLTKDLEHLPPRRRCAARSTASCSASATPTEAEERTEDAGASGPHELGSPVEIVLDVQPREGGRPSRCDAGIYLHTHGDRPPARACRSPQSRRWPPGRWCSAASCPGSSTSAGGRSSTVGPPPRSGPTHAAALINDTLHWTDERWATQARRGARPRLDPAPRRPGGRTTCCATWRERLGVGVPG